MLLSGMCCVYAEPYFLEPTLEALENNLETIYFAVPLTAYDGKELVEGNNKVKEILGRFCARNPKWVVFNQEFKTQAAAYNFLSKKALTDGYKNVLIFDSDEIWEAEHLKNLKTFIEKNPSHDVYNGHMHTYFKSLEWEIDPPQKMNPVLAIKSHVQIKWVRCPDSNDYIQVPKHLACYHHPSHVRSDAVMQRKIEVCSERDKFADWFDRVWLKWTPDMKNFHPTMPQSFESVKHVNKEDLPEPLRRFYNTTF